jgi:hypothetical protein
MKFHDISIRRHVQPAPRSNDKALLFGKSEILASDAMHLKISRSENPVARASSAILTTAFVRSHFTKRRGLYTSPDMV